MKPVPTVVAKIWNWQPKLLLWYLTVHVVKPVVVVPVKLALPPLAMELGAKIEPLTQLAESSKIVDPNEFVTLNCALTVCAAATPLPQIASTDAVSIANASLVVFLIVASFDDAVETFDPRSGGCDGFCRADRNGANEGRRGVLGNFGF